MFGRFPYFKDKSTDEGFEYVFYHLFYGVLAFFLVKFGLRGADVAVYYEESGVRYCICIIIASLVGIALTYYNNRNFKNMMMNIAIGIGIYVFLTIGAYMKTLSSVIIIYIVLTSLAGILVELRKFSQRMSVYKEGKPEESTYPVKYARLYLAALVIRKNIFIAAVVGMVVMPMTLYIKPVEEGWNIFLERHGEDATQYLSVREKYGDEWSFANNIDLISKIRTDESWKTLSIEEKWEVIRAVCLCEARYMGMSTEFRIEFTDELEDGVAGSYSHKNKTLRFNIKYFDGPDAESAEENLTTCIHEMRHCYQHELVDCYAGLNEYERNLMLFEDVALFGENMDDYKDYIDGTGTIEEYLMQPLECDARNYAKMSVQAYYELIDELLAQ